jgi:hypothetical protein
MIALAFVMLLTGLSLAYFTRATTDRQLAHASYNDTSSDLLARTALDIVVNDFKQEILGAGAVTRSNIQPQRSGADPAIPNLIRRSVRNDAVPAPGISSLASAVSSRPVDATNVKRGEVTSARWNAHYLVPRFTTRDDIVDSTPISNFTAPDWVLVTRNGPVAFTGWNNSVKDPSSTNANYVVGRYAFTVYDEGGLLGMNMAGYPGWPNSVLCSANPSPTPWLVNVGRKGTMGFADLTALGTYAPTQSQIDKIAGWRNYAMTQRTFTNFPTGDPGFAGEADCTKQDFYGSYLLYFGDPPFTIESLSDKLLASTYPFTAVATYVNNSRTDQAVMTRQQLLRLRSSLGFSQNVLQYMGTFSRERNMPAPDWPNLSGHLSDGRFNLNNLALVVPNPTDCITPHGKKKGWQTGKNRNHICGTPNEIIELFGLFWVKADVIDANYKTPGHWRYIYHTGPNPPGDPNPNYNSIICWDPNANREQARQVDFFQLLNYVLNVGRGRTDHCGGTLDTEARTFGIGASLIDQYDSGADCDAYLPNSWAGTGCDLDSHVVTNNASNRKYATHTTAIEYGQGNGDRSFGFGMEPEYALDQTNGDCPAGVTGGGCSSVPHRPCAGDNQFPCAQGEPAAPVPPSSPSNPIVISHAFSNVGELGYGIVTPPGVGPPPAAPGATPIPTLDFSSPDYPDAPVLDFFGYNPVSSAYPRAGIVNLYTKNAPVIAALLSQTLKTDAAAINNPPSPVVSTSEALTAANSIVQETQNVLAGTPAYGPVTQTDLTRAIAARLAAAGGSAIGTTTEQKQAIARALAEVGQTRTWNLFIDVIAQTGHYAPNAQNLTDFIPEGEKRYWLHIALGRDPVQADGTPCAGNYTGCQVDVLGAQLEEVLE